MMKKSMLQLRNAEKKIQSQVDSAIQALAGSERRRDYIGASDLGHHCLRYIQYGAMNAEREGYTPKTLRTFGMGKAVEPEVLRWLLQAGFKIKTQTAGGLQVGFKTDHLVDDGFVKEIGGHVDGIITSFPEGFEDIDAPAIWENKILCKSRFSEVVKKGVQIAEDQYFSQVSIYQKYMDPAFPGVAANPALWTIFNRDTSELYFEFTQMNKLVAEKCFEIGMRVLRNIKAGKTLSKNVSFRCSFCPYKDLCVMHDMEMKHE